MDQPGSHNLPGPGLPLYKIQCVPRDCRYKMQNQVNNFFFRASFCLCFCALGMHPVLGAGPASGFRRRVTGRVPPGPRTGCQRGGPASPARGRRGCRREAATRWAATAAIADQRSCQPAVYLLDHYHNNNLNNV